jgi:glyoxylase-like metal-dependent hydrolase (beta-lactamase superfamily II)
MRVVLAAADALGGRQRILAIKTLRIEGYGQLASQLGGGNISGAPDAPQKWIHVTEHERTIDLVNNQSRVRQRNVTGFVFARLANYGRVRQNQVVDGTIAYNVGPDGRAVRVTDVAARARRMEMRSNPVTIVRTAMTAGSKLGNLRTSGHLQTVDITTQEGDRLTLAVDRTSHLPSWVEWVGRDENLGDVTFRTSFSGYDRTGGVLLPVGYTTKIDWRNLTLQTLMVDRNSVDVDVDDMTAPADVRSASAPTAVPTPKATLLAKGIWFITGGSHNSVVFEFADHLTLFEAGQSNAWAGAVIRLARTLAPKPLTEVIVSHHHFDHTGGFRAAVAENLTVMTHRGNAGILREIAARRSTSPADPLGRNPRPLKLQLMDERLTLKDDVMEVQLVRVVGNTHMTDAIAAYVPRERMLVQADMFVADWDFQWWASGYTATVNEHKLDIAQDVPIHGGVVPFDEVGPTNDKQYKNAQSLCEEGLRAGFPVPGCPAKP